MARRHLDAPAAARRPQLARGIAFEQRAELVTFDRGFGRYPWLHWRCLLDD